MPSHTETVGPYAIKKMEPTSRVLKHLSSPLVRTSILLSLVFEITYLILSCYVGATTPALASNAASSWRLWAVILAQVSLFLVDLQARWDELVPIILLIKLHDRPRYRLIGTDVPKVDICITTCGEDVTIAMYTVAAAAAQDYPTDRFEVYLLDDGKSVELRDAVEAFNIEQGKRGAKQVKYLSREKLPGVPNYFKAGNLKFGIDETKRQSGGEFVAALDVDMIPSADWLRAMLPHLLLDDKVAIATPPQTFYNLPRRDYLTQGASIPGMFTRQVRDGFGNASCDGSGFVTRRAAIEMIGGWPIKCISDDSMTSQTLLTSGQKLVFVEEELQVGDSPDTMAGYLNQRTRWTRGNLEVARAFNFYLPGSKASAKSTLPQKLSCCVDSFKEYMAFLVFLSALLLPIAIWPTKSGDVSQFATEPVCRLLGWMFLVSHFATKLTNYIVYGMDADAYVQSGKRVKFWTAPYTMFAIFRVHWPNAHVLPKATGMVSSDLKERSRIHRRPFTERFLSSGTTMHLMYVIVGIVTLYLRFCQLYQSGAKDHLFPIPGALLQLAECVLMVSTPLWYMAFPPTVPELADLIEKREDGLTRPKAKDWSPGFKWAMMGGLLWDIAVVSLCAI